MVCLKHILSSPECINCYNLLAREINGNIFSLITKQENYVKLTWKWSGLLNFCETVWGVFWGTMTNGSYLTWSLPWQMANDFLVCLANFTTLHMWLNKLSARGLVLTIITRNLLVCWLIWAMSQENVRYYLCGCHTKRRPPILLLVWQRQRSYVTFSRDTAHFAIIQPCNTKTDLTPSLW